MAYLLMRPKTDVLNMLSIVAYWMLIGNGAWDFLCGFCMLVDLLMGTAPPRARDNIAALADAHFGMWLLEEDRCNRAAKALFAVCVIQWGAMRVVAALNDDSLIGLISYSAEALLIIVGLMEGLMHLQKGTAVLAATVMCALITCE